MLLKSATFHNNGPFKHYRFEVGHLKGVVAIVAENGTGKSYVLEAGILGAAYRKMVKQGTLAGRATDRDSWVESEFVHGVPFKVRQLVDGVNRKQAETLLVDEHEIPLLEETGVTAYQEKWVEPYLPDREVYLAGPFCAQKSEGFAGMGSAARIDVILKVVGVARLERGAKGARERASKVEAEFTALVDRIKEARGDVASVDAATESLAEARAANEAAEASLASSKAALAAAQTAAADHAVRKTAREAADTLATTLREQLASARARRADHERRLAGNRTIQADAAAIRDAAARLERENAALTRLELACAEAEKAIRAELDPWRDAAARLRSAEQRRTGAAARLMHETAVRAAVTGLEALRAAVSAETTAVAALETELRELSAKGWAGDKDRLSAALVGHETVGAMDEGASAASASLVARAVLAADADAVKAATETPKQLREIEARLTSERRHLVEAQRKAGEAERLAARLADVEAATSDLGAAERELAELRQGQALAVLGAFARTLGWLETRTAARAAGAALALTRKLAERLEPLNDSERRIAQLEGDIATEQAGEERLRAQLGAVDIVEVGEAPDVASAERAARDSEAASKRLAAEVVRAEQGLARAREVGAKVAELEAQRDAVATELADWARLALDLGRKGIQSAEVDSAGPELTALTNDLLRTCHGPRYTVEVKTQRLDSKGKNLIEECHVRVIDSKKGTDKEVSEHSGGECTILAEALSLALTMMGSKRAKLRDFTIVRDESGAALDPVNNRAYVAMLRRAIDVTGARHVLLVSHSEAVQKLCDHIVHIPEAS